MLTQKQLWSIVHYDPKTGIFTWAKPRANCDEGARAGGIVRYRKAYYRKIRILGDRYSEHRLAWFYVYGVWPK